MYRRKIQVHRSRMWKMLWMSKKTCKRMEYKNTWKSKKWVRIFCNTYNQAGEYEEPNGNRRSERNQGNENAIAKLALRRCLERIRKQTGKSIKHWFITELGHEKTERLHLHGIVWGIGTDKLITDKWNYGITFLKWIKMNYLLKVQRLC